MANWSRAPQTPFGESIQRIPLSPDSLVRVVAQIRFAPVLRVQEQGFVAPFQEDVRAEYPLVSKEMQQQVIAGSSGALQLSESTVWRFRNPTDAWQVSLSQDFVSLDCSKYSNRQDFLSRLSDVLRAVETHVRPVLVSRVGVRYTDRLRGDENLERLGDFIRPELLGLSDTDLGDGEGLGEYTRGVFRTDGVVLRGQWGHVPQDVSFDESIEEVGEPSWVLDLDACTEDTAPFNAILCASEAKRHAEIIYRFFRWIVSDEFLIAHGTTP